ncbi:hypothetical protein C8J57DRAFT_1268093 [Mycena rebaudengoi]|nr:hypothetical protein C8J57DRAFT_1268093 [Mycena rebaudengoi]
MDFTRYPRTSHSSRLLLHLSCRHGFPTRNKISCWLGFSSTKFVVGPLSSSALRGPPTQSFRVMHLVYLGLITDRVPIISLFQPSHIGRDESPISFGEMFDIPRLRTGLGKQVLDWPEVKDSSGDVLDDLGCWNVYGYGTRAQRPFEPCLSNLLLPPDLSFTKTPNWVKMIPDFIHDEHSTFWALASLAFPATRAENLVPALPSPVHNVSIPPDEHLLCYDYLYYVGAHKPFEIEEDYSPAWRYAGQHMHFLPSIAPLADQYVRRALGIEGNGLIPPLVSIHVRHGDFDGWCDGLPVEECFAPLSVIARRVREVQDILKRKGITAKHVVMTSDEKNETWWRQVADLGWKAIEHSQTKAKYGPWSVFFFFSARRTLVIIDAVVQSQGIGFVGTDRSTMSILARKRIESWNDGTGVLVQWGTPDADDH